MTKSNLAANLRRYMKLSETTNTIEKLAEKSTVSKSTISNILNERGETSLLILELLANALNVNSAKLLAEKPVLKSLRYRANKSMSAREKAASENLIYSAAEWMNDYSDFTKSHPQNKKYAEILQIREKDPIELAKKVRKAWGIEKSSPIFNLEDYIYDSGIIILGISFGFRQTFGVSIGPEDGGPAILVNTDSSISAERQVFTMAHELGHILMHCDNFTKNIEKDSSIDRQEEKEADIFASNLLMPEDAFVGYLKRTITLGLVESTLKIKRYFGLSYEAVLHRLCDLTKLDYQEEIKKFRFFYKEKYKHDFAAHYEPQSLGELEFTNSSAKESIFSAVKNDEITLTRAGHLLGLSEKSVSEEYRLWLSNKEDAFTKLTI